MMLDQALRRSVLPIDLEVPGERAPARCDENHEKSSHTMFRTLRQSLTALTIVIITSCSSASWAGGIEPVQRLGRYMGFGWGDGYHACAKSGCRLGADLPPRSYHTQFNQACCPMVGAGCKSARRASSWSCRKRAAGGCDSVGSQSETIHSDRPSNDSDPLPTPERPASASDAQASLGDQAPVQLTAELAESQKRPIRPLPPRTERRINIPDPIIQADIPRPIRPQPPLPKLPLDLQQRPSLDFPDAPSLSETTQVDPSIEQQIVSKAINDMVLPEFVTKAVSKTTAARTALRVSEKDAQKPVIEIVPQVATVPDWLIVRQPR